MEAANSKKMFLPGGKHLTTRAPVVFIFDSHISLELIELARNSNIHLLCLPSHLLQPLDVSVFGPVKSTWKKVPKEYQIETCAGTVTKEDFQSLIARPWEQSFQPAHLQGGFRKTGLSPINRDAIPASRLTKSLSQQQAVQDHRNLHCWVLYTHENTLAWVFHREKERDASKERR